MYSLTMHRSSETIHADTGSDSYNARMELNARIHKARRDAGLTQDQLANATGKTRGAVTQWEKGEVRPRHTTLLLIAKATGKSIEWLENAVGEERVGLMVIGEVAAGLWKEGTVEYTPYDMPVAAHPDYPAGAQRLYQVKGNSVNRTVSDGEYMHCVDLLAAGLSPESGDLVIVRRMEHDLTEYTAKRYVVEDGKKILRPDSNDPQWQADIELNGHSGVDISITDLVIAKWSPIKRRGL